MSWTVFINKCNAKTGKGTTNKKEFVETLLNEYDASVKRHIDVMSGGNTYSTSPSAIINILDMWTEANLMSPPQTVANVNILDQLKFVIPLYWIGAVITGPMGVTNVLFPGIWLPVDLKQNLNYTIMLSKVALLSTLHMKTMFGTFVSSATGLIVPWSGSSLMSA